MIHRLSILLTLGVACTALAGCKPDQPDHMKVVLDREAAGHRAVEPRPEWGAQPVALVGGTVLTSTGQRFAPGYVLMKGGLIQGVGAGDPAVGPEYRRLDVSGGS